MLEINRLIIKSIVCVLVHCCCCSNFIVSPPFLLLSMLPRCYVRALIASFEYMELLLLLHNGLESRHAGFSFLDNKVVQTLAANLNLL